jgi:hypothetical protein
MSVFIFHLRACGVTKRNGKSWLQQTILWQASLGWRPLLPTYCICHSEFRSSSQHDRGSGLKGPNNVVEKYRNLSVSSDEPPLAWRERLSKYLSKHEASPPTSSQEHVFSLKNSKFSVKLRPCASFLHYLQSYCKVIRNPYSKKTSVLGVYA